MALMFMELTIEFGRSSRNLSLSKLQCRLKSINDLCKCFNAKSPIKFIDALLLYPMLYMIYYTEIFIILFLAEIILLKLNL